MTDEQIKYVLDLILECDLNAKRFEYDAVTSKNRMINGWFSGKSSAYKEFKEKLEKLMTMV